MNYFVTGATGFIGGHLIDRLLDRKGTIYVLVRRKSKKKFAAHRERWGRRADRVVPVTGDLSRKNLGVSRKNVDMLRDVGIRHFFHLAAIYDLNADAESQHVANVDGTRNAVSFASVIDAGVFHHTSSIAAAGMFDGIFREDMFDEATGLGHPYFRTKHDAEAVVRTDCEIPFRVYRPGIVVGDSETGEIDKTDGPYYFFKLIQKLRDTLPTWIPLVGIEGGRFNIVPVDYVVDAMDYIAHTRGEDGGTFHLTEPHPRRIGEVLNLFAEAAHAPKMSMRVNVRMFGVVPGYVWKGVSGLPPVRRMIDVILADLGIPRDVMNFVNYPTRFDSRETERVLKGSGIEVPDLETYAWRLWDYWDRRLDPDLHVDHSLSGAVKGKNVVITGGSSGIGQATAYRLAEAGAHVILVARGIEALQETRDEILSRKGRVSIYSCDLTDVEAIDALAGRILEEHDHVDILVNNAGRSIRRSVELSYDRFHDFTRTIDLNYYGALRMMLSLLPGMTERRSGQIVNISSIGVLSNAPRFSAYVASKAALDAFTRCAASEFSHKGISFTTINMPLVRTPMIAPTRIYDNVPTISPDEAAELVADAIVNKKKRIATRLGIFAQISHLLFPKVTEVGMNAAFQMFPDSAAAKGLRDKQRDASADQIALAQVTKGIHW